MCDSTSLVSPMDGRFQFIWVNFTLLHLRIRAGPYTTQEQGPLFLRNLEYRTPAPLVVQVPDI